MDITNSFSNILKKLKNIHVFVTTKNRKQKQIGNSPNQILNLEYKLLLQREGPNSLLDVQASFSSLQKTGY